MADKLEWLNRHFVLLRHKTWQEAVQKENYKIRPDLMPIFEQYSLSAEILFEMKEQGRFAEGCEFLAYVLHRRVAVWWGYLSLLSLQKELKECPERSPFSPEQEKLLAELKQIPGIPEIPPMTIDNIGKLPDIDWKKELEFSPLPPQDNSGINAAADALKAQTARLKAAVPGWLNDFFAERKAETVKAFQTEYGITPDAQLSAAVEKAKEGPLTYKINRADSPRIRQILAVKDANEAQRQAILAQIKSNFPEKFPPTPESAILFAAREKKIREDALDAVYGWIAAPDEGNTQKAFEAGNAAAGTPEGLLANTAFWSFGNLAPNAKTMVQTPPGLAATGLKSVLLMLALTPGGTRSKEERYAHYFNLGTEAAYGANLWASRLEGVRFPHDSNSDDLPLFPSGNSSQVQDAEVHEDISSSYEKWTPRQNQRNRLP